MTTEPEAPAQLATLDVLKARIAAETASETPEERQMGGKTFTATLDGVRTRFVAVEHFNVGPGWMCRELDGKLKPGIYGSSNMTDVVFEGEPA